MTDLRSTAGRIVHVLIVDDSPTMRRLIRAGIETRRLIAPFQPEAPAVAAEASAPNPATGNQPVFAPIPPVGGVSLAPFAMERPSELLDPTAMLTPQAILDTPPDDGESGISLAHSAVEAIMSTTIAAEVAEAVRRALNAIDAVATPVPQVTADDLVAPHPAEA